MTFTKGTNILRKERFWRCIVADEETAVFARIRHSGNGSTLLDHKNMISVSNINNNDFKCTIVEMADIKKHYEKVAKCNCQCGYD